MAFGSTKSYVLIDYIFVHFYIKIFEGKSSIRKQKNSRFIVAVLIYFGYVTSRIDFF